MMAVWRTMSRAFNVKENTIVFNNFNGKGYGDNPKYIAEEILKQQLNYHLFWLVKGGKEAQSLPDGVESVPIRSFKGMRALASARVIVNNVKNPLPFIKKPRQYYIQTWHGAFGLKYIENDAREHLNPYYIRNSIKDSRMTDLFLSNSNLQSEEFRTAFCYDGEIMECGMPRNDFYFRTTDKDRRNTKRSIGIAAATKVLLYCPTFRDDLSTDAYKINWNDILAALDSRNDGEWVILVRLHPNILHSDGLFKYSDRVVNVSSFPDMQPLTAISDLQITDYSSTIYDSILLNTPVILYTPDIKEYQRSRGLKPFYFELPFVRTQTMEQLIDAVRCFDPEKCAGEMERFSQTYQSYDHGHAAKQVVERIKHLPPVQAATLTKERSPRECSGNAPT